MYLIKNNTIEIGEREGGGQVLVATEDMLPGTELCTIYPLLSFDDSFRDCFARYGEEYAVYFAAYNAFCYQLLSGDKAIYLNLFSGSTDNSMADIFRREGLHYIATNKCDSHAKLSLEELDRFVKVCRIFQLNGFEKEGVFFVFSISAHTSHSCMPNCFCSFAYTSCGCRTIQPVKQGEQLTINFNPEDVMNPTFIRREKLLHNREFTCHCPRCDSPGDDTRQFSCFDNNKCNGRHMVCHPREKAPMTESRIPYTGVEYVEPHLLPCTDCGRAPPLEYQQRMFALEAQLPSMTEAFKQDLAHAELTLNPAAMRRVLDTMLALELPPIHTYSVEIFLLILRVSNALRVAAADRCAAALNHLKPFEHMLLFPNMQSSSALLTAAGCLLKSSTSSAADAELGRAYFQRALRMGYILGGRTIAVLDPAEYSSLQRALNKLPPQPPCTTACMFCGETPQCAAITLSRCGRCKKVAYCSTHCQKAHWGVHKAQCKQGELK